MKSRRGDSAQPGSYTVDCLAGTEQDGVMQNYRPGAGGTSAGQLSDNAAAVPAPPPKAAKPLVERHSFSFCSGDKPASSLLELG